MIISTYVYYLGYALFVSMSRILFRYNDDMTHHPLLDLVVYQIYPRSFQDSNNDGIGDIPGIIQRLDYVSSLGINAIWLTPVYPSPMVDFGYDITDHCAIDPVFGTMEDMERLIFEAHKRDIKIIMEFIPNHTSDQHPWFLESRSSRDNPKRDWYIWKYPKPDGSAPNNWLSIFSGSAWEFDQQTGQYYLHNFTKEQPDLNWYHPDLENAMMQILTFWIKKGVDGFRVDAIIHIFENPSFKDEPKSPDAPKQSDPYKKYKHIYTRVQPAMLPFIEKLSDFVCKKHSKLMVSEAYETPRHVVRQMYERADSPLYSDFHFCFIGVSWDSQDIQQSIDSYYDVMDPWFIPSYPLGNHDIHRVASRYTEDQARALAVVQFTLRGVPYIYYGEEIGMIDGVIPPENIHDPRELQVPGKGLGRDPVRTPMQWDKTPYAGFSTVTPWLPVATDVMQKNVAEEEKESQSMLHLYKKLIALRKEYSSLRQGSFESLPLPTKDVYGFRRVYKNHTSTILVNFSQKNQMIVLSGNDIRLLCSSYMDIPMVTQFAPLIRGINSQNQNHHIHLRPFEAVVLEVISNSI